MRSCVHMCVSVLSIFLLKCINIHIHIQEYNMFSTDNVNSTVSVKHHSCPWRMRIKKSKQTNRKSWY